MLLCPWNSPGKNTAVGCHSLLQGIFLTQESNPHLLTSPALACGFFTTSSTWEAHIYIIRLLLLCVWATEKRDFPDGSVVKNLPANAGDAGLVPGLGRCPGEGHGNPLQYSCLENPLDRGNWWATVHEITKSRTWLSDFTLSRHKSNKSRLPF